MTVEFCDVDEQMETIVRAPVAGIVRQLHADVGASVQAEDLLIVMDAK